jgi:phage anti-repressor protein
MNVEMKVVESGLVPVYEDGESRRLINAREMHEFLESGWQYTDWIKERIEKYGFVKGEDYEVFQEKLKNPQGGRPATEYFLTIDTAKELAMVENNERGRQVRKYFIECEKRAKIVSNTTVIKDGDRLDLQRKRLDIMGDNARLRKVKAILEMIRNPKYPLTEDSRQVLCAEAATLLTGHSVPAMLPDAVEKLCSNTDIAGNLGTSNRKVMKLGRDLGLVAPEGEGNEFGTWKMTKSPYSPHECVQWYWNEAGREKIISNYSNTTA